MSSSACNVCLENYNKSNHCKIVCDFCEYSSCKTCCEKYIISCFEQPHCMNCKREWNKKILVNKFTRKFIDNELKKHQQKILFDTEKALMPSSQLRIEQINNEKHIENEIKQSQDEIVKLRLKINKLRSKLNQKNTQKSNFIKKCTNNDCRGFLSTQWKCGICNHWTCPDCHEVKGTTKDTSHSCKQENIETAKLLDKDTKSCPKCGVQIFRSQGCAHMFCTQCHTAFDWKTGNIEKPVHNPHYFEWLKQNGNLDRNPLDIQCGREIDDTFIRAMVRSNADNTMINICRKILHIRFVDLPRFSTDRIRNNEDLRIKYLLNEIDENKFKIMIERRNKQQNKNREILNVLSMFVNSTTDIIYRYVDNYKRTGINNVFQYKNEIENLKDYVNKNLQEIADIYKNKTYEINRLFNLI